MQLTDKLKQENHNLLKLRIFVESVNKKTKLLEVWYDWSYKPYFLSNFLPFKNRLEQSIYFKCIHNIASASHTNPCHIADFYEKRKRQSQVTSTKPHTIASIHRLIRTMYYLITHNKLYDYHLAKNH